MRAIDGDALMAKLGIGQDCSICKHDDTPYCCWNPDVVDVCEAISEAPTIEPERPKSKWIDSWRSKMDGTRYWYRECKHCGYERNDCDPEKDSNFCPDCGAEMTEGEG
jgi:hypothetical protein